MRQEKRGLDDVKVVEDACEFFKIFKGLIVDLILSSKERDESRNFFNSISAEDALKVKKYAFDKFDVELTYSLLFGAIGLDTLSFLMAIFSNWTVGLNTFKDGLIDRVGLKDFLDEITCVSSEPLTMELWEYIFSELQKKSRLIDDSETVRKIFSARGDWVLQTNCLDKQRNDELISYVLAVPYDESILMWHIATELLINDKKERENQSDEKDSVRFCQITCCTLLIMQSTMMATVAGICKGWRKVDNNLKYVITARSTSAFLNGPCHWVAAKRGYGHGVCDAIVSFSLGEEVFGEMEVPDCLVKKYQFVDVAVFDGSLLLAASFKFSGEGCFTVWMMKEYGVPGSWTKLFDIPDFESHLKWIRKLVAFRQSGKVLLAKLFGQLVFYDPKTEEIFDTKIRGNAHSYLDTFVESLVLLNVANEFTELEASEDNGTNEILEDVTSSSNSQIVIDEANGESKEEAQGESISTQ
ncbi:hypothetical protein GH714_002493 [Hevea brasiliensis]|uniref:F-box associated domain-containing protein n=1 Tax=Hevea brasiliensis TaxID=3981 RepID=A0A6A6KZL0_HEVBR|nr:hypothetical protein GH714_002493 [Hevea brasiliensis]